VTTALILNITFATVVFVAVLGLIVAAIATQHKDHGISLARRARVRRRRETAQPRFSGTFFTENA
jgi:hypothetical protein